MSRRDCAYIKLSLWLTNHKTLTSFAILCCALSWRVFLAWRATAAPAKLVASIPDATTYMAPAESLLASGTFHDYLGRPDVTRTPGYPAFLAFLIYIFGANLRSVLVAQAIALSLTVLLLYRLARKILPPVMAAGSGLLAAMSPWSAVLAGLPLSDGLFLLLLSLIFVVMNCVEANSGFARALSGGALLGAITAAAVLTRPIVPLIFLVVIALALRSGAAQKRRWVVVAAMLICALAPLLLWQERNRREGDLNAISDIAGKTAWRYLASRVRAEASGQDRWQLSKSAYLEEQSWNLSSREADKARWRRAMAVFKEYPLLTAYCFLRSAVEHAVHPSPDVLAYARLSFQADSIVLAVWWALLLSFAAWGIGCRSLPSWDGGAIDRSELWTIFAVCALLTLSSGVSFGAGARLRAPLELVVPLLASIGFCRLAHACLHRLPWKRRSRVPQLRAMRAHESDAPWQHDRS